MYRDFPEAEVILSVDRGMTKEIEQSHRGLPFEHIKATLRRKWFDSSVKGRISEDWGWSAGPSVMRLLCARYPTLETIYLIGFDLWGINGRVNNVYKGSDNYVPAASPECPAGQWIKQMKVVFETYPRVSFIRIGELNEMRPREWRGIGNVTFQDFTVLPQGTVGPQQHTNIVFISFFTEGYEDVADKLIASLKLQGLIYDVEFVHTKGAWLKNVQFKPSFILKMLKKYAKADAVVWIDADAIVNHYPKLLFDMNCDMAVHHKDGRELLSGTMYWAVNDRSQKALESWIAQCKKEPDQWEQRVLQHMMKANLLPKLVVGELPTDYCKIFDSWERADRGRKVIPIIEHFQHSRQIRRNLKLRQQVEQP